MVRHWSSPPPSRSLTSHTATPPSSRPPPFSTLLLYLSIHLSVHHPPLAPRCCRIHPPRACVWLYETACASVCTHVAGGSRGKDSSASDLDITSYSCIFTRFFKQILLLEQLIFLLSGLHLHGIFNPLLGIVDLMSSRCGRKQAIFQILSLQLW